MQLDTVQDYQLLCSSQDVKLQAPALTGAKKAVRLALQGNSCKA